MVRYAPAPTLRRSAGPSGTAGSGLDDRDNESGPAEPVQDEGTEKRRVFLAIDVPADLRQRFGQAQRELQPLLPEARWTRAESMHVTVKFLGAVDTAVLAAVQDVAADVTARYCPSALPLQGLGGAPGLKRPRVVWIACRASAALARMQQELDEALGDLGFPKETRPFRPHVTLARVDPRRSRPAATLALSEASESALRLQSIPVAELVLLESVPQPHGVRYRVLSRFPLAGGTPPTA